MTADQMVPVPAEAERHPVISLTADQRAVLYDWHNALCLRDQSRDIDFWNGRLPTGKVLVAGAGTGRVSNALASERRMSVGLDIDQARIRRLHLRRTRHTFAVHGDCARLPFARTFDAVLFPYSVVHLLAMPVLRTALSEAARVLHPRGMLGVDMSLGFRDKPATDWRATADGWCAELGCRVTEWMRQRKTAEIYTAEWMYRLAVEGGTAFGTFVEEWRIYEVCTIATMLGGLGFTIEDIRHGYGAGVRPARRLIIARKDTNE